MKENFDKLFYQRVHNENAIQRARETIHQTGRALPCKVVAVKGSIVTVSFEVKSSVWTLPQITIPKAEDPWVRSPTQVNDFGWTVPADCYLGGVSGLGGGTADLSERANLTGLVFVPISNANSPPIDQGKAQIQGPNGSIIGSQDRTCEINIDKTSGITMAFGGHSIVINGSGVTIDGILWDTHEHKDAQPGLGNTGGPISA
jgi:hypothetical protein